jgi:hypothetical protein
MKLRNDLARAIMYRGIARLQFGRLQEAVTANEESISINRVLVEQEHRHEMRRELAMAIMYRGVALEGLGRLEASGVITTVARRKARNGRWRPSDLGGTQKSRRSCR